jgi:hypothetical protein
MPNCSGSCIHQRSIKVKQGTAKANYLENDNKPNIKKMIGGNMRINGSDTLGVRIFVILVMIFGLVLPLEMYASGWSGKIKVKKGEEALFVFSETDPGSTWKAASKNYELKISRDAEGYKFSLGSPIENYKLKKKELKYKLYNQEGKLRFKVKIKPEDNKIKISRKEEDLFAWSLKKKAPENKYKVKKADLDIGKVKYYPEKGKIKVKDTSDNEICSLKTNRLCTCPVICLFTELDEKDQLLLFAVLVIVEQEGF